MTAEATQKFPPQIKYIIGNEAAERFSFYGMRSIVVIFMVSQLKMSDAHSEAVFHLFTAACYLLPLLGAYLSDRFWGKYKTIMRLSLFYCVGHGILALWESQLALYVGMGFIALGSGGIKPCVSALVGDQFTKENKNLVEKVFSIFYWSVNFGSTFATILIPYTLQKFGSKVAFGIPGILMAVATLIFWLGRKQYVNVPPSQEPGFMTVLIEALRRKSEKKASKLLDNALGKFSSDQVEEVRAVGQVMKVFVLVSIFWSLYDQHAASWVILATKMNLNVLGINVQAAQVQSLNPILILVLIPVFSVWVYPFFEKLGFQITEIGKMKVGMFVAASSFLVVTIYQHLLDQGRQLSVAWQAIPFFLLTSAEVLVSVTGLEFAYTQAPRKMKSTIMSFWLLTIFAGNLLTAYVSEINIFKGPMYFLFFAVLMLVTGVVFAFFVKNYQVKEYLEE